MSTDIQTSDSGSEGIEAILDRDLIVREGYGSALSFDGVDDYIDCGNNPSLDITDAITIEVWVKIPYLPSEMSKDYMRFVWTNDDRNVLFYSKYNTDLEWKITTTQGSAPRPRIYENDLLKNQWVYFASTYDHDKARLYLNGFLKSTVERDNTDLIHSGHWYIGSTGYTVNGLISQVRISDTPRTPAEIAANWNNGVGRQFPKDANTVGLWLLNEGTGSTIYDETANHNDGIIHGALWTKGNIPLKARVESLKNRGITLAEAGSDIEELLSREIPLIDVGSSLDIASLSRFSLVADSSYRSEAIAALLSLIVAGEASLGLDRLRAKIAARAGTSDMKLPKGTGKTGMPSKEVKQ